MDIQPDRKHPDTAVWLHIDTETEADWMNNVVFPKMGFMGWMKAHYLHDPAPFMSRVGIDQLGMIADTIEAVDVEDEDYRKIGAEMVSTIRAYEGSTLVPVEEMPHEKALKQNKTKLAALIGILALSGLGLYISTNGSLEQQNTSTTTIIAPMTNNNLISPSKVTPPYAVNPEGHGISAIVDCGFIQDPKLDRLDISSSDYATVYNPLINVLPTGRQNSVEVHEIDDYGSNNIQLGWSDAFGVRIMGDLVIISSAVDGTDVPAATYTGKNSPNGSFTLNPGNVASGQFNLMDYTIENYNGRFYLGLVCDAAKTQQLLRHDNVSNP